MKISNIIGIIGIIVLLMPISIISVNSRPILPNLSDEVITYPVNNTYDVPVDIGEYDITFDGNMNDTAGTINTNLPSTNWQWIVELEFDHHHLQSDKLSITCLLL